jgi:copper chaperone CopZ
MSCTGCEETITKSTLAIDGVTEARASFKEGKAWIAFDSARVTPQQISTSIQSKGYEVTGISFTVEDGSQPTDGDHESGV